MSSPRTPLEGVEQLIDQLREQFEAAARGIDGGDRSGPFDVSLGSPATGIDLADRGDEYVLTVDVPGYEREDLEVALGGGRISIAGEREHREETGDDEAYIRRERRSHSFERVLSLPGEVDADDVDATVRNGVLTVRLPKRESESERRSIDIE